MSVNILIFSGIHSSNLTRYVFVLFNRLLKFFFFACGWGCVGGGGKGGNMSDF